MEFAVYTFSTHNTHYTHRTHQDVHCLCVHRMRNDTNVHQQIDAKKKSATIAVFIMYLQIYS